MSTYGTAPPIFEVSGRQKSRISLGFCLLLGPCIPVLKCPVDKNHTFPSVFVYFQDRAPQFSKYPVDKKEAFTLFFVYF